MIAPAIAEPTTIRHVDNTIRETERASFTLRPIRIKPRQRDAYGHWPAGVGGARVDVQREYLMAHAANLCVKKKRARSKIHDGRSGDAELE